MTKKNICENCTEFSVDYDCGFQEKCVLMKLFEENKKLKKSVKNLRDRVKNLEAQNIKNSWVNNPEQMGR